MQESMVYHSIQKEKAREIAPNLLRRGGAIDMIAPSTGLSIDESAQN